MSTCLDFKAITNFHQIELDDLRSIQTIIPISIFLRFHITAQNFIKKRTKLPKIEKNNSFYRHMARFQGYY